MRKGGGVAEGRGGAGIETICFINTTPSARNNVASRLLFSRAATPPRLRRGVSNSLWAFLVLLLLPLSAFAEYRTFDIESLRITLDTDWPQSGAPGYFPLRLEITNLAEAREIEISAVSNRWFDPYRRRPYSGRAAYGGYEAGRTDIRQRIRLKRGDHVKITLPVPVFADNERVQIQFRENGLLFRNNTSFFSFQSGRPMSEAGAVVVSGSSSSLAATVGLRSPPISSGPTYMPPPARSGTSSGPKMDISLEPSRLPANWLGYTTLRTVILGPEEWKELNPAQQDALLMWTASGGDLIFADGTLDMLLPAGQGPVGLRGVESSHPYYLGNIHLLNSSDIRTNGLEKTIQQIDGSIATPDWALPAVRASDWGTVAERGFRLPIEGAGYVPTRAYLSILTLFVALIGPLNYIYLWKKRRQVLMVLTVPLISAVFIVLLAGYGILSEGFAVRARAVTFTLLDQNSKKAATRASVSLYPGGVIRSGGVHFASDTAIYPTGIDGYGARGEMDVDLTGEQNFQSGLLQPRSPNNYEQIRFQPARQRLNFEHNGNELSVVNGLGANIQRLYYREGGQMYALGELAAGERGTLKTGSLKGKDLYQEGLVGTPISPKKFQDLVMKQPDESYLAVLETSPFWEPGVQGAKELDSFHVVFGYAGGQP
jgi:hypothetical protein